MKKVRIEVNISSGIRRPKVNWNGLSMFKSTLINVEGPNER